MKTQIGNIQIHTVTLPGGVVHETVAAAFHQLEQSDPQLGIAWLNNLSQYALKEQETAQLIVAHKSDGAFVACPIKISSTGRAAEALTTFYSSLYEPAVVVTESAPLFQAIFTHLRLEHGIGSLSLAPMDPKGPLFGQIRSAISRSGWRGCHDYFCFGNWFVDTGTGSFRSYLSARSSQLQNTLLRRTRGFLRNGRGKLTLVDTASELEQGIADFVEVYNSSWKKPEPFPEFIPNLIRVAADRGWLRLGVARYDDEAIAAQIWFVTGETAYIYKLAYREEQAALSPGTVLTGFLMEHAIDRDRVSRIDYLSGDDTYKRDWMTERRERRGIAAYNPKHPSGALQLGVHQAKRLIKALAPQTHS
ncbi:MAG: GNAT family N-acetyltransferase [Pseudomonadota bacterium]